MLFIQKKIAAKIAIAITTSNIVDMTGDNPLLLRLFMIF
jgi:hypothetical protein